MAGSWTRTPYDPCAYQKDLSQSTSELNFRLDPIRYYAPSQQFVPFGLGPGNAIGAPVGADAVDIESELRNQTRLLTKCPEKKFLPLKPEVKGVLPETTVSCRMHGTHSFKIQPLPEAYLAQYFPKIDNTGINLNYPGLKEHVLSAKGQPYKHPPQFNPVKWQGHQGVRQYRDETTGRLCAYVPM